VGSRGCAALGLHMLLDLGVQSWIEFLISLIESPGMRSGVPGPAPGPGRPVVAVISIWGTGFHRAGIVACTGPCTVRSALKAGQRDVVPGRMCADLPACATLEADSTTFYAKVQIRTLWTLRS
jgi:hypothetical protein